MADVASAAGVNKGTVSRALRGDKRISAETRTRIWTVARNLGYEVDAVASGLSTKRTGVAAVVVERLDLPWTGAFLAAVSGVLARFKTELLLFEAGSASAAANVLRRIESRKADGTIWAGEQQLLPLDVPIVRVGEREQGVACRVWLDEAGTCDRVRALANGRPLDYRGGSGASMGFLSALSETEGAGSPFVIEDGIRTSQSPDLVCGDESRAISLRALCLRFPARELGVLAARVLMNFLHERGARPATVLARPVLLSAAGEPVLGKSVQLREKGVQ